MNEGDSPPPVIPFAQTPPVIAIEGVLVDCMTSEGGTQALQHCLTEVGGGTI
jgi:hypothetical protein